LRGEEIETIRFLPQDGFEAVFFSTGNGLVPLRMKPAISRIFHSDCETSPGNADIAKIQCPHF
jgi:hypothetical protein